MPALITHDYFGRSLYDRLYSFIGGSRDEAWAFLLGNQGPDPLFYLVISPKMSAHSRLGHRMHSEKPSELLAALKASLSILGEEERAVGRAYAFGFLCHYLLDSTVHPFVYFNQFRLTDAGEPGLSRKDGSEVHGVIESELDELVLFERRGLTIATFNPAAEILKADDFVLGAVSKIYAYLALAVYGTVVPEKMFTVAVKCFRCAQRALYSPRGRKRALFGGLERLVRPHSFYQAMSHRPLALTSSVFDNRSHEAWENPFTGELRRASFWDLFDEALEKAPASMQSFDAPGFNQRGAQALTGNLDFSGEPTPAPPGAAEGGGAGAWSEAGAAPGAPGDGSGV